MKIIEKTFKTSIAVFMIGLFSIGAIVIFDIHDSELFRSIVKILYVVVSFIALSTGLILTINSTHKQYKKNSKEFIKKLILRFIVIFMILFLRDTIVGKEIKLSTEIVVSFLLSFLSFYLYDEQKRIRE